MRRAKERDDILDWVFEPSCSRQVIRQPIRPGAVAACMRPGAVAAELERERFERQFEAAKAAAASTKVEVKRGKLETAIFIFDSAISKLLVGNSNQRRGGGARWRGAGCPRAAVVMTPLRNATACPLCVTFSRTV